MLVTELETATASEESVMAYVFTFTAYADVT